MNTEINQAPRSVVVIGGSGESGRRIVRDLRLHHPALRVVSASRHRDGEVELPAGVTWCELDIERPEEARDRLRAFDLAVIALGPMEHVGARAHSLCLEAGVDCVDINDSLAAADAILALEKQATANGCRIYTGLGLSPGLSTLLLLQLAHGNASASGLYRSRLYMGAAHGGGKTSPHALVASFRKQLEVYRDGRRQRITSPWRDVASRFRFPGHDQPLALIPYATPETATLARNGAQAGITGLDSRFHVQFLPQGLARTIAAIAPGPALREAVARRFHASGQAAKRRRGADPTTTLWVYPDDRPQDGLAVHGPLSAYDLTSAMVCAVIDGIAAGWLQTPPGVWSLDGHTTPDQVRRIGDALRRRGVLIRPASIADDDAERFRFGWCQAVGDSVRTLRHYQQSWYTAAVPLPPALGRLQWSCLRQSELWTTLRGELGVAGFAALLPRIARRWFGLHRRTAPYRRRQPPWPTIARDFSLFAAGYGEIRQVLGQERALALYRRMFLDSGRMEMRWLWPDPELFALLPDPVAAVQDYWSAYLDDCEALGVLEVRRDGDTFQLHNCAYAILFHLLGCPELSGLVREMEREALSGLARAAGLDLEWHPGEDGTAEISLRPLRAPLEVEAAGVSRGTAPRLGNGSAVQSRPTVASTTGG